MRFGMNNKWWLAIGSVTCAVTAASLIMIYFNKSKPKEKEVQKEENDDIEEIIKEEEDAIQEIIKSANSMEHVRIFYD
jgi:hypothetical protein